MSLRAFHFCLSLLLASVATAQIGIGRMKTDNLPGDGVLPPGAINITELALAGLGDDGTGLDDLRGAVRVPNGHYIVSQGPEGGNITKKYFEFDAAGNYLASVDQPFLLGAVGDFGLTDLAWDHRTDPDSRIWAGRAKSIMSFNWQTVAFDQVIIPGSALGLKVLDSFVGAFARCGTIAEVDGLQVYVASDVVTGINYYALGLPLPTLPIWQPVTPDINPPLGLADSGRLGAAFDMSRGTVWWSMDARDDNPNPNHSAIRFFEMNMDGSLTGQVVQGIREIGGIANGCEMYIDPQGNPVMTYIASMGTIATSPIGITFDQDIMIEMYMGFQFGATCGGDIAFETEPYIGNLGWTITLENAPANPLSAAFLFRGKPTLPPGLSLPGLTNCGLLLDLGSLIGEGGGALPLVNGSASWVRPLPGDISLVGAEAAFQWLQPTSLAFLPLDLSNAGAFRVGTNL